MNLYHLDRDLSTEQCRLIYTQMHQVVEPLMESFYKRKFNHRLFIMSDERVNYSYTLLRQRSITQNTYKRSYTFTQDLARYVAEIDANPAGHMKLLITTMIDDVVHELHHLILETDPTKYATDKAYAMTIETRVKLNTLHFLDRFYSIIAPAVGDYDLKFLDMVNTVFNNVDVRNAVGHDIIRPF